MIKKTHIAACAIAAMTLTGTATTAAATPMLTTAQVSAAPAPPQHSANHIAHASANVTTNAKSPAAASKTKPNWLTIILKILKWILGLFGL